MKHNVKKIISILLTAAIICTVMLPVFSFAADGKKPLQFNNDGKFRILQFADMQDNMFTRRAMTMLMEEAIRLEQPDLIVLTGDNIHAAGTKLDAKISIKGAMKPIAESGVPFTFTFGNHDAENVAKEYQLGVYQKYSNCYAYDADPELTGCATHNLTVLGSDGKTVAFNLWLIDSNMYDEVNGGYDYVHEDQLTWYKKTAQELKEANGGTVVPALAFQHICVPETYELLKDAPDDDLSVTRSYLGTRKLLALDPEKAAGVINEWPCPPGYNSGELDAFVQTGDVIGLVTGHDHINSFIGNVKGVDLIQTAGIGFSTYGNELRGYRVITLDENDPSGYETYTKTFFDIFGNDTKGHFLYDFFGGSLSCIIPDFVGNALAELVTTEKGEKIYLRLSEISKKLDEIFD